MTRGSFITILILLFISLLLIVGLLGWSLAIGWVLMRVVDFRLFEGTLLGLIASLAAGYILFTLMSALPTDEEDEFEDDDYDIIDASRFFKAGSTPTSEQWFRFQTANAIYAEFQEAPDVVPLLDKSQTQELSIRLTDLTVAILKQRTKRSSKLSVSIGDFRKQMQTQEMQPYDDKILGLAVEVVNSELKIPMVASMVQRQRWDNVSSRSLEP